MTETANNNSDSHNNTSGPAAMEILVISNAIERDAIKGAIKYRRINIFRRVRGGKCKQPAFIRHFDERQLQEGVMWVIRGGGRWNISWNENFSFRNYVVAAYRKASFWGPLPVLLFAWNAVKIVVEDKRT